MPETVQLPLTQDDIVLDGNYLNARGDRCRVTEINGSDVRVERLIVETGDYGNSYYLRRDGTGYPSSLNLVSKIEPEKIDETAPDVELPTPEVWPQYSIGADPEMILEYKVGWVNAASHMKCNRKYSFGDFGTDGHPFTAEWRPKEADTPFGLVRNLQQCFVQACKNSPSVSEMKWHAGSYVGGRSIGGHIHFGMSKEPVMVEMLNRFLAGNVLLIEDAKQAYDRKNLGGYGVLGDARDQPWGWEYRPLSSWISSPMVSLAVLSLAKHIINQFKINDKAVLKRKKVREFLNITKIREPYKNHDVAFWRELHDKYWPELMSWPIEPSCEQGLRIMESLIKTGYIIGDSDIKTNWGIEVA